jgi:hypothetical protein
MLARRHTADVTKLPVTSVPCLKYWNCTSSVLTALQSAQCFHQQEQFAVKLHLFAVYLTILSQLLKIQRRMKGSARKRSWPNYKALSQHLSRVAQSV